MTQQVADQRRLLKVYSFDELAAEERTRQTIAAIGAGLGAAGNAMAASNAGYYNSTATVYGPRGTYDVSIRGYDPTAAAIAQSNAAAANAAMIDNVIETGRRNMAALETTVLKDNTLLPGEWYGGRLHFDPPAGEGGKTLQMSIWVGDDVHGIVMVHVPAPS